MISFNHFVRADVKLEVLHTNLILVWIRCGPAHLLGYLSLDLSYFLKHLNDVAQFVSIDPCSRRVSIHWLILPTYLALAMIRLVDRIAHIDTIL